MEQFYFAKSESKTLLSSNKLSRDSSYHYIKLSLKDKVKTFFITFSKYVCLKNYFLKNDENKKIYNMYYHGQKRLVKDFNIERVVSDIKDIKNVILMKFKNIDKIKIKTCKSKILDIDEDFESSTSCSDNGIISSD